MNRTSQPATDISRILFYTVLIVSVLAGSFGYGLYSAYYKNWIFRFVEGIKADVETVFAEKETITGTRPVNYLQPARKPGDGVTVNSPEADPDELILIAGFFDENTGIRLVQRNGAPVAQWSFRYSDIFPDPHFVKHPPETDWNIDLHGTLALPDGSVLFNFEYAGLVKMDRCGKVVWKLEKPTHHSIEPAEDGGFWAPGVIVHAADQPSPFPPFDTPLDDDTVMKISADGKVEQEFSVTALIYENGLAALLTATGESMWPGFSWDREILHLNKVGQLHSDLAAAFPMFSAGDLLMSIRESNLVLVADPATRAIKWWRIGPWVRQHDPEFSADGKIVVFNNNAYKTAFLPDSYTPDPEFPPVSNIIELDPATGVSHVLYGERPGQELLSVIRGKLELTPRGGLLVTEFEGGRVFETTADGRIIWEYISRYSADEVAEITEARSYPRDYFTVTDWSCD